MSGPSSQGLCAMASCTRTGSAALAEKEPTDLGVNVIEDLDSPGVRVNRAEVRVVDTVFIVPGSIRKTLQDFHDHQIFRLCQRSKRRARDWRKQSGGSVDGENRDVPSNIIGYIEKFS